MKRLMFAAAAAALLFAGAAAAADSLSLTVFTDDRDGKTYKWAVIGGKKWMAENLDYQPWWDKSWCYGDDGSYCGEGKYGRLYDWNTARVVCPRGWHLPSRQEWGDLAKAAGGSDVRGYYCNGTAGRALKSKYGWCDYGNGTDAYGFSALPGGWRVGAEFVSVGYRAYWWTADNSPDAAQAYSRSARYDDGNLAYGRSAKSFGYSVRCVADERP